MNPMVWACPLLAWLIVPVEGNYWTHLMAYSLGCIGGVVGYYEIWRTHEYEERNTTKED